MSICGNENTDIYGCCNNCNKEIEDNKLKYNEVFDMYLCHQCTQNLLDSQHPDKRLCACCERYFDKDDVIYTDWENVRLFVYEQYPDTYLCDDCLCEVGEIHAQKETEDQLRYDYR